MPLYKPFATPNDTYYSMEYNGDIPVLWHLDVINAPQAWDISYGTPDGKVGIVDGAILETHEDLQNVIAIAYDGETETTGSSSPPSNTDDDILTDKVKTKIENASFESAAISSAIDMENRAIKVYSDRAESADDQEEKDFYKFLADWERGHNTNLKSKDAIKVI